VTGLYIYLPRELLSSITPGMGVDVSVVHSDAQDSAEPNTSSTSIIPQSAVQQDTSEIGDKLSDYDVEYDLSAECPESISMNENDAVKGDMPQNKSRCLTIQRENKTFVPRKRKRDPDQWRSNKAKRM